MTNNENETYVRTSEVPALHQKPPRPCLGCVRPFPTFGAPFNGSNERMVLRWRRTCTYCNAGMGEVVWLSAGMWLARSARFHHPRSPRSLVRTAKRKTRHCIAAPIATLIFTISPNKHGARQEPHIFPNAAYRELTPRWRCTVSTPAISSASSRKP